MNTYKIGVFGSEGVVGKGICNFFEEEVVAKFDPASGYEDISLFKDVDLAIVCVPTPIGSDGMSCNTSIVENVCLELRKIDFEGVVLIKSTIIPSALTELKEKCGLRIVFSPEFMGESKYYVAPWNYPDPRDMKSHTWQVFGGDKGDTSFCVDIFKRKMGVDCRFFQTSLATASLAKYIENSFFAMKVTFVNEWYDIAEIHGVDWNELRELWLLDPRINRNHTLVFPKNRGYGGKCFPKDTKAIIAESLKLGCVPDLMMAMDELNDKFKNE